MPENIIPLAVQETNAAKMLDLGQKEFRHLVNIGALPPPVKIGGHERWSVETLSKILSGNAHVEQKEDFE